MNTIKKVFARFLIVCWLGVLVGTIIALFSGEGLSAIGGGAAVGLFVLVLQFIFYGFLHPLKLIEVGVVDN